MTIARRITVEELSRTLPLLARTQIRNDVTEACVEIAETRGTTAMPQGVEFWSCDGELVALAQADELEAGIDHGAGTLLAEFEVGTAFHRCLVCGQRNGQPSSWCSRRCRNLLRSLGRTLAPGLDDGATLAGAERWAAAQRNAHIGWGIPLTRSIAEALWLR